MVTKAMTTVATIVMAYITSRRLFPVSLQWTGFLNVDAHSSVSLFTIPANQRPDREVEVYEERDEWAFL